MNTIYRIYNLTFILYLLLILLKHLTCKNEISMIINQKLGNRIINQYCNNAFYYYSFISEVIVNEKSGSIDDYTKLLIEGNNNITIKFNAPLDSCEGMFDNFKNILYIDFSNFISSKVKNMYKMFYGCIYLTSLNLNNFDTSSVTNMGFTFHYCKSLRNLNLSNFNTSSVTNMAYMFSYFISLSNVDLSNFDTSSVTDMSYMFQFNYDIELNIKNFITSSVQNMSGIFNFCYNLRSLDLSNFNTSSVINMTYMFSNCHQLKSIDMTNFNFSSAKYLDYIFYNCKSLESLNLANINIKIQNIDNRLDNCNNLNYSIDENKNSPFLKLLKSYENICSYICINNNSQKYLMKEDNIYFDDYESNNLSIVIYQNCNEIANHISNKSYLINIIILLVIGGIIIGVPILIYFFRKKLKKIKIIFSEGNQNKYEVKINQNKYIGEAINLFYEKNGTQCRGTKLFMANGNSISSSEEHEKKIKDYIIKDNDGGNLDILVCNSTE